jgi:hypothetical protein
MDCRRRGKRPSGAGLGGLLVPIRTLIPGLILVGLAASVAAVETVSLPAAGRMALTPNGQTAACIDAGRRAIVALDPIRGAVYRDLVAPAHAALPEPVAVGFLTGDVVAMVCRAGDEWSLRTSRTIPDGAADPAEPLQVIKLGAAPGGPDPVSLVVSHVRGWLAVVGLPAPLPPVLRAAVAGVRLGPLRDRGCPTLPVGRRPVAATVGPADELVLALRGNGPADEIAFYEASGAELLRLPSGLRDIGGITFGRGDGTLWATGRLADGPATGLWRLDATLRDRRQAIQPVLVAEAAAPRDVVAASARAVLVVVGEPERRILRIDPVPAKAGPHDQGTREKARP